MILWELAITQRLIGLDPADTATYRTNEFTVLKTLVGAKERLAEIGARMNAAGIRLVVSHDAYQYLERRLNVGLAGMLSDYTEIRAGARTLSNINHIEGPVCIINTPEISAPRDILPEAPRIMIDPMGAEFADATDFPAAFYQGMAIALNGCFSQP